MKGKIVDKNDRITDKTIFLRPVNQKRTRIRTKDEFLSELKKLSAVDKNYLNYSYLRQMKRSDLLWEAVVHFGGWRNTVKEIGFRPIQKSWTNKEVVDTIRKAVKELGYIPTSKKAAKLGYHGLGTAARRRFGSWTNALVESGIKPFRKNWTKENVITELKEIHAYLGHSPSMRDLKELDKYDLLNAGLKFFKSYNNFLRAAELPIVLEMNKWPKEKIKNELKVLAIQLGRSPRRTELAAARRYDLINAVERNFNCWSDGLTRAGLVPNPDILDDDKTWKEWENLIFDVLKKEKITFFQHFYIKKVGYPDAYIPTKKEIIEIKLNCSDNSVKKDIEKYLPYCEKLEIWYLFGKPFPTLSNKVYFVGPDEIKEKIGRDKILLKRFYVIKNREGKMIRNKPKKILLLGSGAHRVN